MMSMNRAVFQAIDTGKIKDLQFRQYFNVLYVEGTVPKVADGGTLNTNLRVSSIGDFLVNDVTGQYTSFVDDNGQVDDGENHLSVRITDGDRGREIFDDYIPLYLWLTPGRTRSSGILDITGARADPSQPLFYPKPFPYCFGANTDILLEFKNDADWENYFKIAFWGTRVKSWKIPGIQERPSKINNQ